MWTTAFPSWLTLIASMLAGMNAAQEESPAPPAAESVPADAPPRKRIPYRASQPGAPVRRVSGGGRLKKDEMPPPAVYVLAPDTEVLTLSAAPTLPWYVAGPTKQTIRVSLSVDDEKTAGAIATFLVRGAARRGPYSLILSGTGAELHVGEVYRLGVDYVDADGLYRDSFPSCVTRLRRVSPSPELAKALEGASVAQRPFILAEHGIWCDALSEIGERISQTRGAARQQWLEVRDDLIRQITDKDVKIPALAKEASGS